MSKIIKGILISDARQKVLSFFCQNPSISIHDSEVGRRYRDRSRALREVLIKKAKVEEERKKKVTAKLFRALEALPYTKEEADRIIEEGREEERIQKVLYLR